MLEQKDDNMTFGFADLGDGVGILIRQANFQQPGIWESVPVGSILNFRIESEDKGLVAKDITVAPQVEE